MVALNQCITHSLTLVYHVPDIYVDDVQEDEEVAAEDEEDMGVIETYSNYKPSKLKVFNPMFKLCLTSLSKCVFKHLFKLYLNSFYHF